MWVLQLLDKVVLCLVVVVRGSSPVASRRSTFAPTPVDTRRRHSIPPAWSELAYADEHSRSQAPDASTALAPRTHRAQRGARERRTPRYNMIPAGQNKPIERTEPDTATTVRLDPNTRRRGTNPPRP
ncbi:hypothetical protein C8R46DRAFT_1147957 [Mycena filopes]|nr:hypothetical protein C8R46DRAFT_1147957 [Mycena filopes]